MGFVLVGSFLRANSGTNLLVIMTDDHGRWALGQYDRRIRDLLRHMVTKVPEISA